TPQPMAPPPIMMNSAFGSSFMSIGSVGEEEEQNEEAEAEREPTPRLLVRPRSFTSQRWRVGSRDARLPCTWLVRQHGVRSLETFQIPAHEAIHVVFLERRVGSGS